MTTADRVFAALSEVSGRAVTGSTTWAELDHLDSLALLEIAAALDDELDVAMLDLVPAMPGQTIAEWLAGLVLGGPRAATAVRLREVHASDVDWLRHLTCRPDDAHRWRFRGEAPNIDAFVTALGAGVLVQHVIETTDARTVGLVTAFGPNLRDGVVSLAVLVTDPFRGSFHALAGVAAFVQLLFDGWPFRKVYIDVPEFNLDIQREVLGDLFVCEGRLREHAFHRGRYWDVAIYALTRERFAAALPRLVGAGGGMRRGGQVLVEVG